MSREMKGVIIGVFVFLGFTLSVLLIYFAGVNATNNTNTRLDHIGTACTKAGNLWLDNNCIPKYPSPRP